MAQPAVPITRVPESTSTTTAFNPGIRRYPKGHPKGGKFMPKDEVLPEIVPATPKTMIAYKGFNFSNNTMSCRNHEFEIGKYYEIEDTPKACYNGFHACENPFDVFTFYGLSPNRAFGKVELTGPFDKDRTKVAAKGIKVLERFSWPHLMNTLVKYARENPNNPYVKENVRINGDKTVAKPRWDLVTGSTQIPQQQDTAAQVTQMSTAANQIQQSEYSSTTQFAFGPNSVQIGCGWQVSHGYNCLSIQQGYSSTEVHGVNSQAILRDRSSKVRGIAGTQITFAPPDIEPVSGIIGQNGLEPMQWLRLKDTNVRRAIYSIEKD